LWSVGDLNFIQLISADCVIGCNRQKSNVSRPLDCFSDMALMCRTVSGDSAWDNLAALRNKETECTWLFVVDSQVFLSAKTANFTALERTSLAWSTLSAWAACWALARSACWTLAGTGWTLIS